MALSFLPVDRCREKIVQGEYIFKVLTNFIFENYLIFSSKIKLWGQRKGYAYCIKVYFKTHFQFYK